MSDTARELASIVAHIGKPVRLAAKPWQQRGYVVALVLAKRTEALVRWTDTESTLEVLDDLVDEHDLALTDWQAHELEFPGDADDPARGGAVEVLRVLGFLI
jgi:hypothetical protein